MMKKLLACLLCLLMLAASAAGETTAKQAQSLLDSITAYHLQSAKDMQTWLNQQPAGMGAEWYAIALSQSGAYDLTAYREKLRQYLAETTVHAATSRQKYALSLLAAGAAKDAYVAGVMEDSLGKQGITSWIYGLHLLNNGCQSTVASAKNVIDTLLSLQFADGGWALMGTVSDVDITAMVLQALAPHASKCSDAIERALALLSSRQQANGGFSSFGVANPESAAQVLLALAELGIDGLTDARFIKNGCTLLDGMRAFQLPDGSFSHTMGGSSNYTATAQVFLALTGYQLLLKGQPGLYLLENNTATAKLSLRYQEIAAMAVAGLTLLACLLLWLLKKRHYKNFLAVLIIAAALITAIYTVEFQSASSYYTAQPVMKTQPVGTVTLTIRCDTAAGKSDAAYIPKDGVILEATAFAISEGDTVYDILTEAVRAHRIPLEVSGPQGMIYVTGINHLYEHAFGDLSGWTYQVNGETFSMSCDQYKLKDGDKIAWLYTCELGNDLK